MASHNTLPVAGKMVALKEKDQRFTGPAISQFQRSSYIEAAILPLPDRPPDSYSVSFQNCRNELIQLRS